MSCPNMIGQSTSASPVGMKVGKAFTNACETVITDGTETVHSAVGLFCHRRSWTSWLLGR
jgi:hypothetical protein